MFSSDPATKDIIRKAIDSTNRNNFVGNIVQFLNDEGLDGVDIDWEYPESVSNAYSITFFSPWLSLRFTTIAKHTAYR